LTRLESILRLLARDLAALQHRWALVGGLAVSARIEPRFTRDIDLAVAVAGDREAEATIRALQSQGYRVQALIEHEPTERLATTRLIPPGEDEGGVVVDMLFASSGVEAEIAGGAEILDVFPGLPVPVARVGHLVALKLLARDDRTRPQDRADLVALLRGAGASDLDEARATAFLISQRGFHRGRDLAAALQEILRDVGR
jgi:predicted nucleotidyltransferase